MHKYFIISLLVICISCKPNVDSMVIPSDTKTADHLAEGFANPPQTARPQVWWHWMNGNITEDGIRKDIEWFHRIGLGGFHVFDANFSTPQIVEKRLIYMQDDWKDAFRLAVEMADSLGMDVTIPSSPGFSSTGGPWVKPENAMKKVVWREMDIEGGRTYEGELPDPFFYTGKFQDYGVKERDLKKTEGTHYEDIAVVAVKLPDTYKHLEELGAEITSSGGSFTLEQLTNGKLSDCGKLPIGEDGFAWIQYSFPKPQSIRALSITCENTRGRGHAIPESCEDSLQISDDGIHFKTVLGIPKGDANRLTISFETITARHFRLKHRNPRAHFHYTMLKPSPDPKYSEIAEFVLYPELRINKVEGKAGYSGFHDMRLNPTLKAEAKDIASHSVDITDCFNDGILKWDVPEGKWRIFRFGASLTGKKNHPASPEATGYEVDKLDPEAWDGHFREYLDMNKEAVKGMLGEKGIRNVLIDSYEAGHQNWTPLMKEEFIKRRGYDPLIWMPVLTGIIVNSTEESEQFLFDWRKTINELITENYNRLTEFIQNEYGMKGCFIEAHANGTVFPFDGMALKKAAAYPMSEIWIQGPVGTPDRIPEAIADIRESASVAHIYGQNITAAETFTAIGLGKQAYSFSPAKLKPYADIAMANGVNLFVIHDSAHQPLDSHKPGLGLGVYGQWFNRHETWAEQAQAWIDYLARSSFMLQQGTAAADILWFYGEDCNITGLYSHSFPNIPQGYSMDFINPDGLMNEIFVKDGKLCTRTGMEYSVLCIDPNISRMSPEIVELLEGLKDKGVAICGQDDLHKTLKKSGVAPDIKYKGIDTLRFVHRVIPEGHIWWVNSPSEKKESSEVSFKIAGMKPQLWNPVTGKMEDLSYRTRQNRTIVELDFDPHDAYFIVFRENTDKRKNRVHKPTSEKTICEIEMEGIGLWNEMDEWKYFAGTREFCFTINIPKYSGTLILDLGQVYDIAEVSVNNTDIATLWKFPFRADITDAVGNDDTAEVKLKVTNLWVNRIIGDAGLEEEKRSTYTPVKFYKSDDPLLPSGIAGPIRLIERK